MKKIGTLGEELVSRWLESQCSLLQRNWRCRWGEIDIIVRDRDTIAFVEVKTRSKNNWDEGGLLAIDSRKQQRIINAASLFLAGYPQLAELPCRFDVALVSYESLSPRRQDAEKRETKDVKEFFELEIGQSIIMEEYELTIENYIQSAFELT